MEVTFAEARAHLGLETQRQWSDLARARTTPVLFGLFSLIILLADALLKDQAQPVRTPAWYMKARPTFMDAIALGRRCIMTAIRFSEEYQQWIVIPYWGGFTTT
jgi:hypothetical protein